MMRCVTAMTILGVAVNLPSLTNGQASTNDRPIMGDLPRVPLEVYYVDPPGVVVETLLTGLDVVWSLEFASDGRMFLTEKAGRIRVVSAEGELDPMPWASLNNVSAEIRENGLNGLALHPQFAEKPWIYVMYTVDKDGDEVANRISRFREVNGRGMNEEVLLDDLPGSTNHNGGRIRFGPDGMLYVGTGDARVRERAQRLDNMGGSILRITPEGAIPDDNPWPNSPIWAYGMRNPLGIAFRPEDGALFVADHGPTTEWEPRIGAFDELNLVQKGKNYGWPRVVGAPGIPDYVDPLLSWIPSVPPGDLIFHNGDLYLTALWSEALVRMRFQDPSDPNHVTGVERWFNSRVWRDGVPAVGEYRRVRALAVGPDGAIYMGTSNRDGRFEPGPDDDRVVRIVFNDD
ncbi:MAG: PQQ-dependent sugar dehydrogenase [Pseudomonadota bacterium]|nr:PQQ-dependent sugar dehydrogenase [Pseudomonadota bacterium]